MGTITHARTTSSRDARLRSRGPRPGGIALSSAFTASVPSAQLIVVSSTVIRSGPWPLLRALLARLATNERARPITVLCHRRDESALAALSASGGGLGLEVLPLFYPRFETFNTSTLRRLVAGGAWRTTFVLDASRTGRGESLEHVTTAVSSGDAFVWNAGGMTWRQKTLRERLSRESYALVRGLLRWHARTQRFAGA